MQLITDPASLWERLRSAHNGAGLNQAEMAQALSVSPHAH